MHLFVAFVTAILATAYGVKLGGNLVISLAGVAVAWPIAVYWRQEDRRYSLSSLDPKRVYVVLKVSRFPVAGFFWAMLQSETGMDFTLVVIPEYDLIPKEGSSVKLMRLGHEAYVLRQLS